MAQTNELLCTDELLRICNADGISIGGVKVKGGWKYSPYYLNGTDEKTEVCQVGTWYSPDTSDEVTVFAIVTSSYSPTDNSFHIESWLVCWVEDMGDMGTNYISYILPYSSLKKYFQRWIKDQRCDQC